MLEKIFHFRRLRLVSPTQEPRGFSLKHAYVCSHCGWLQDGAPKGICQHCESKNIDSLHARLLRDHEIIKTLKDTIKKLIERRKERKIVAINGGAPFPLKRVQ